MYSYEERLRAVKLYIKYDHSLSAVIRELGYQIERQTQPDRACWNSYLKRNYDMSTGQSLRLP